MKKTKKGKHKSIDFTYIKYTILTLFFCLLFVRGYVPYEETGVNFFYVTLNGVEVGSISDALKAEELLINARKNVAATREGYTFLETELGVSGEAVTWGLVDGEEAVQKNMESVLWDNIQQTLKRSYTLKVNEYMVNLSSLDDVNALLQAAINQYDDQDKFHVSMVKDNNREFSLLTPSIYKEEKQPEADKDDNTSAGVEDVLSGVGEITEEKTELDFSDYEYGILEMNFAEKVEVVEAYLPAGQLTPVGIATEEVIKEQEVPGIYEVVAGDTLTRISEKVNLPIERIMELNSELLPNINVTIHIGNELVITVPEPELSVEWVENNYYEEYYDADVIYIDNDEWYTTKSEIRQQPSSGFRRVVAQESYLNGKMTQKEILKEEIVKEAVPKIIERGTKIPPTYIKPITGGRITSGYGSRKAPVAGATTNHRAIDWYVPTGTAVFASSGGKVTRAGWLGSYGYVIFIDHEDGKQTRYAHLSKILVKTGDYVKQGAKIALSGSTGRVTGPHLHFEMLIDGVGVNPLLYLDK